MNPRIKELELEAAYDTIDPNGPFTADEFNQFNQKFAQLIVFECTQAVMDGTKEGDHYAQRIEQHFDHGQGGILHFGVEE